MKISEFGKNLIVISFALLAMLLVLANLRLPSGWRLLSVQSGSMEPTIGVGSLVLTKPLPDFLAPVETPKFASGDVVTFSQQGSLVSHRVVETVKKEGAFFYRTKGDANKEADNTLVGEKNIVGKVSLTIPYLGRLLSFVKQPLGYLLMIVIPCLFLIFNELLFLITAFRKTKVKAPASGVVMPLILLFAAGYLFVGGTKALFSDNATSTTNTFSASESFPQLADHLVINEVMFDPPNENACGNEGDAEWVEIYNPTASPVNLDTWALGDSLFTDDLPNVSLPAGGFAIVSDCIQSSFTSIWSLPGGTIYIDLSSVIGNGLNNGGEHMRLLNGATLVDSMSYGSNTDAFSPSVVAPVADHSLERDPDGQDTDTAVDFVDRTTPTPGT